jgi:16S rRNA C967 or C1407 C5-methylase (RsmB/RsmF family)
MVPPSEIWRAWLGEDAVPPPLDRFLSRQRADKDTFAAMGRATAWAATVAAALVPGAWAEDREGLLSQLRGLPPRDVLLAADACADRDAPRAIARAVSSLRSRLRDAPSWGAACVSHGVPAGWAAVMARRAALSGEGFVRRWLAAQCTRPPLWVRPREEAVVSLRAEGWKVEEFPDGSARVTGARGIETSSAFRTGKLEVQDRASQQVALLAVPRPGQVVWDVCAGRGGKTVLLGHALAGRGSLHATDTDEGKLAGLKQRVRRAGLADVVRVRAWAGEGVPAFGPEARRGFDVVLVDAPCSSTGTWRRNPDARLRMEPGDLARFAETQKRLVELGMGVVKKGGKLVYSTCSVAVEEDEDVVGTGALYGPPELDSDTLFGAVLSVP